MIAQFIANKVFVCGKNPAVWAYECYSIDAAGATWTKVVNYKQNNADNPLAQFESMTYNIAAFIYSGRLWLIDDFYPKVFDLSQATPIMQPYWESAANPPFMTGNPTYGGGCPVVVGDYVYLFGGARTSSVRRFYLRGLTLTAIPTQDTSGRKWESLTELPSSFSSNPYACATVPTNRNQIMLEVWQADGSSNSAIIYDTYQNTFTTVASTSDLSGKAMG
jgi:hypothetical protein